MMSMPSCDAVAVPSGSHIDPRRSVLDVADPLIDDNPAAARYEARVDGILVGWLRYRVTQDRVALTHTEVDPAYGGRGIAGALVRRALDDVRAQGGRSVDPVCDFVRWWISGHPDYGDLLSR